jgi:hypothetical protein
MELMMLRRAATVALMAGGAMLLAPAPAYAEYVCWMSDGIRYCYDPNDGKVPVEPEPAPVEPTYVPTPPVPTVEQPWIQPVPVQPGSVQPVPVQPAPVPAAPQPAPVPVPVYVPPQADRYYAAAEAAPAPAEEVLPAEPAAAEVPAPAAVPTASAGPTAVTVPSPAASPSAVVTSAAGQTGSAEPFDALPVVLIAGGVIAVAAVAWLVPPVRRALLSLSRLE